MFWYFTIEAREGDRGYADDMLIYTYKSHKFQSFAECYESYLAFDPYKYWPYLRSVQREYIMYQHGDTIKNNHVNSGLFLNLKDTETELGITEEQFVTTMEGLSEYGTTIS